MSACISSKSSDNGFIEKHWPIEQVYFFCSQDMYTEPYTVELTYHMLVHFLLKRNIRGAEEMTRWLRDLAAFP